MKRTPLILVIVALLATLCIRAFLEEPVETARLKQLRKGMTKDEVLQVLGPPTTIYESGQWTYQRKFIFGYVNLQWEADGTYDGDYNYERF